MATVLELRGDGSFDAGGDEDAAGAGAGAAPSAVPSAAGVVALKDEGNALLKAGELQAAVRKYGEAVAAWKTMEATSGGGDGMVLAQCHVKLLALRPQVEPLL